MDGVLVSFGPTPPGTRSLVCIPHAGAGASVFAPWVDEMRGSGTLWAVRLPGRESLIFDEPLKTIEEMARLLVDAVESIESTELILFGHCSGALVAHELAHMLIDSGDVCVTSLVVSGHRMPPADNDAGVESVQFSRADLVTYLRDLGGTSEILIEDPEFLDLLEPAVRCDTEAARRYTIPMSRKKLNIPVFAISGRLDAKVDEAGLAGWSAATTGRFESRQFDGDHFFLFSQCHTLMEFLRDLLSADSRS